MDTASPEEIPKVASCCWKEVISALSCAKEIVNGDGPGTMIAVASECWAKALERVAIRIGERC